MSVGATVVASFALALTAVHKQVTYSVQADPSPSLLMTEVLAMFVQDYYPQETGILGSNLPFASASIEIEYYIEH